MAAPEVISVLMAFDANYAPHGAACLASLLRHSTAKFDVTIASSADLTGFADRIRRSFAGNDRISIDIKPFALPQDTHFPLPYTLTPETYLRFWVRELLPGRARALYVDPDTIATGSVDELWHTDLQGRVLAAVPIPNSTRPKQHGMPPGSLFFNAGVLLIDLDAWEQRGYRDRCLAYLRAHPERAIDGDQDIINLVAIGDWLPLDYVWNVINPFYRPSYDLGLSAAEVARVLREARIVHFNGSKKPWYYLDNHPRQRDYLQAVAQTDWRDWRPADRTVANMVRKRLSLLVPERAKRLLRPLVGMAN
jgi:lipopolysaccharide biosynthesis glycosyltransferase